MAHTVQLCQTQLNRMPGEAKALEDRLVSAGVSVEKPACLSLCFGCSSRIVARLDGAPVGAGTAEELGEQLLAAVG